MAAKIRLTISNNSPTINSMKKNRPNSIVSLPFVAMIFLLSFTGCKGKQSNKPEVEQKVQKETTQPKTIQEAGEKVILIFGNSLTAGYGLEEHESFPSLIQKRIDSLALNYTVVNAGLSGETTAGGNGRIDWVLKQPVDVFVLELGGNDVLRGLDLGQTEKNLRAILTKVRKLHPEIPIILAGMQAPPNMGEEYTTQFASIYPKLANEYDAGLIPFLLDGVAGNPGLNLPDGIHPNAKGQKIVVENVWVVLKSYLK